MPESVTNHRYRLVEVEWIDACSSDGSWSDVNPKKVDPAAQARSVGWLIQDTDKAIVVAPHLCSIGDDDMQKSGDMTIPRSAIIAVHDLERRPAVS